jgi:subtilisin family serine protease
MRIPLSILVALGVLTPVAPALAADASRELIVQLSADAAPAPGYAARPVGALPLAVRGRFAVLGLHATRAFSEALSTGARPLPMAYHFHPERIVLVEAPDAALAASALVALAGDPLVDWVEPNLSRSMLPGLIGGAPAPPRAIAGLDTLANDPYLRSGAQWALMNVGATGPFHGVAGADIHAIPAWRASVGANDLKLAVADTGIDPAQPELGGLMPDGTPRIVDEFNATDSPDRSVLDYYGHGTPVVGIMASRTNDGPHFAPNTGVAGVCGGDGAQNAGCRIVPIKIAPDTSGEATTFDIARGIVHAADVGARAVNMSFAGEGPSRTERLALTYALFNGCVPVGAAGNSGFDPGEAVIPLYPAQYARDGLAISVGASDERDQRATFSSYPSGLDLLAPGSPNIYTTFMTYPSGAGQSYPGYAIFGGTSAAAPHVTGAVGLLAAARPELIDDDAQHVIRESADDIGAPGVDPQTAHGRLNAAAMLARVGPDVGIWHAEVAADSVIEEVQGTLHMGEGLGDTLVVPPRDYLATRFAVHATVAIPDSFQSVTSAWTRVGGTFAARGDFTLPYYVPWAEVVSVSGGAMTLRGFVYRIDDTSCQVCAGRFVPVAPADARFAFTVIGPVLRPPTQVGALPSPFAELRATPMPFERALTLHAPGEGTLSVIDASGREVRRLATSGGVAIWDGRDARGVASPAGVYWVRFSGAAGRMTTRVVKLGR